MRFTIKLKNEHNFGYGSYDGQLKYQVPSTTYHVPRTTYRATFHDTIFENSGALGRFSGD